MNEDSFHLGIKALIKKDGRFLLMRVNPEDLIRYTGEPYYDLPGGRIHREEKNEEVLKREIEEETGISDVRSWEHYSTILSPMRIPLKEGGDVGLILSVYVCEVGSTDSIVVSAEHLDYGWFDAAQAAELLAFKFPKEFTDKLAALEVN